MPEGGIRSGAKSHESDGQNSFKKHLEENTKKWKTKYVLGQGIGFTVYCKVERRRNSDSVYIKSAKRLLPDINKQYNWDLDSTWLSPLPRTKPFPEDTRHSGKRAMHVQRRARWHVTRARLTVELERRWTRPLADSRVLTARAELSIAVAPASPRGARTPGRPARCRAIDPRLRVPLPTAHHLHTRPFGSLPFYHASFSDPGLKLTPCTRRCSNHFNS
ncbi:unnamed protein product [Leptidea sinapis]|uniref:Uncharacterized protein n=1 Tax=Leptidea sinapis TaxID=189913 RepID=A0A5E4QMT2_9NEOP|nr:unnamed protein product [Leptidea sinapis]